MFKNIVRRVLSGLLAVMMLVSDISVPAYADITSPESTEPTGTVTADAEHPASGENDVDLVRELLVTPIGTNSFYKVEEDDYTGSEYVPGYKVVYADRELDEDYHAIASDVINTASGSDYGMMASSDGKKVAYMLLSECRTTKTAPKLYLYCHATEDGATVSNSTDNFFNVTDDADSNDMMSTQVSINVRRVYDPEGNVTERVVRASSLDSRVNYDVTIATKRAYQLKATVPMYVCMYGYRGTGSIITPDSSVYSINNYSTIKQSDNATVNDIVKVTEMTVMKDDDHGADTVYAVGCLDEATGVYYYWFSKPSDGDSATKEGITKTVAELKATGAYHVMTAEEKTNASGKTAVCYIDNDEDGTKEWLFKKSGDLRNNKYLMETVSEIKQGDYELKSNLVVDNFDFDTYFATKQTGESLTDERYEGMRMQVTSVTAKPTSWTLVPMSTINKKAGEIAMSISPVGIVENSSAVDLSEASNGYDVTAASWCIEASECDKETGSVEPDDAQKLGLKVKASMAGSNLNAEGCFPAVTVTYTVAPVVNDDPLRHDLLLGIRIASAPTLMTYRHGDTLNREGMVVMATYEEAGEKEIVGYGIEGKLEAGQTSATVYYNHEGEIKTATLDGLTVENYLTGLKVTSAPLTTTYKDGETFDDTGMTVYKEYANGDEVVTTDYTISNAKGGTVDAPLAYGQKNVILTCKEAGETVFTSQSINVQDALTGLEITHAPYKTAYSVGDAFDASGMVVTAHYASGTSKAVTGYTLSATTIASGMDKITVSYTEDEVTKTVDQPIVSDNVLSSIEVTTAPDATEYFDGDDFDTTGMVVTACYTNGTKAAVTGYTVTDGTGLTAGKENVTISFTKDGVTKTCKLAISVTYKLTGIEITTAPSKTAYKCGDNFETKGMVVQAEYSNGSKKVVSEYTVTDGSNLATGKTDVTVSYTEKGVTKTVKQGITVEKVLTSISATTAPTKTTYLHGEDFDKTGMVVTATYSDATKAAVTGYTVTDGTGMKYGKTGVTVSYTEKGVTKKCTVNITVNNGLDSIYVSTNPTKTNYNPGDNFDKTGMVITAKYGNGTSKTVAGYVVTGGSALTLASKSVTISYTESGITKTCKQSITVNDALDSIEITTAPTKVAYQAGEDFDTTGMVVKAKYISGASKTLTTYAVGNGKNLVQGRTSITISYSENSVTKTADQAITVSDEIMSIAIETPPDKTEYLHGESFSTTGMVISGTYKSGAKIAVSGYTHDGDYLEIGDDKVTISYKENGKTVKCTQAITVGPVAYTMLLGENSVVNATADSTFRSAAPYSEFKSVTVDGDTLAATDYTKSEGSTVIKLKKEYIETLSGDVHELIIYSKGGTTTCNFYVENISVFYKISGSTLYIRATEDAGYTERDLTDNCENGWINNTSITSVVFEEPVEPVSCAHFFDGCSNITSFSNLSDFHGERATSMAYMFRGFKSLDGFDLTKLETSNAVNMSYMFQNCSADELDLSNFNTENVTAMTGMFSGCTKLEKITLGGGFEFVGTNGYLPVISDSNVSGADGKWYTKEDDAYTPAQLAALNRSSTVTYYSVPPAIATLTLEKAPTKTTYLHGEAFDKTGAVVKATNEYGFTKDVSSLVNWDTTINSGMTEATGTFRNKKVTTPVTVSDYLDSIAVTTAPTKTEYKYGDDFDTTGMVVTATMASGAEKTVSGFTVTDGTSLKLTDTEVTISYTEGSVTKTCKQAVTVSDYLTSVVTESDPTKTEYNAGDNFDAAGMVVKAVYASGAEKTVTGYTVEGGTPLTAGQTTVTVKFTDGGIEKTCTVYITVKNPLTSIEVTTPPTKTEYKYGEDFVKAGMVVTATFASGATKTVNVTVTDGKNLTVDKTNVTLSYTENGVTKTCTQDITVTDFLTGISVTTAPTKTTYQHGDDFDSTGMVVKAAYAGGGTKVITPTVISGTNLAARTESVTLSYTEGGVTKTCAQAITVNDILKSITIETAPTKVNYSAGEDFDATGMVIKATYESGYADTVTATATNGTNLTSGQTKVTLSYTENGVTKTVDQDITVGGELSGISVTTAPTKTAYKHGDNFDSTGMVVTASYTGGGSKTITDYTVTDGTSLTAGKTTVTLSYTDGSITKTCTQDITVADILTGISVTTAPTKTAYKYGETFSKTGMVVTASYASGASKPVTGYTTSPTTALTLTDTSIAISYTEDGVTKNASQTITVADVLTGISVTTAPTKTAYKYGDTFDKTGMVVTANYASGASKAVTDYTTSPITALTLTDTSIAISYTEGGVTKNASQTITVADVLTGVSVTTAPTKTAYKHGDDFASAGMVVKAAYASGAEKTVTVTATDGTNLAAGKTSVTLSYTENGVTKTCTQAITVADVLTGISVTTAPTKTAYKYGETFSKTGMVVTASYASGASKPVTGYTTSPTTALTLTDTSIAISYTEDGVTKNASQTITVADVLTGVEVTAAPTKTAYKHGDDFDSTGITVTATMASGAKKTVTATATDGTSLTAGKTSVTLSYTEDGVTKTCTQAITVADYLTGISVTTAPTKTAYKYGDTFDKTGMVVTASYVSGASKPVTGYTTSPTTALTLSDTSIAISYTEDGVTKNASQTITVTDVLTGVEVTAAPTKTAYKHGDDFVSTGMTVKATYASGASKTVTVTATDGTNLTAGKTSVTLSYTEGGITKTCTQAITVADVLTGVSVTTAPTKTAYKHGDDFASVGMVVTASYASGASKPVTATVTDGTSLTAGKTDVTLSYTENGVTKTCKQNITVADVLTGISVTTAPTKTAYKHGDNFASAGMVVKAAYASGASKTVTATVTDGTSLTAGKTDVTLSYTENGVTKTCKQTITVADVLTGISVTTAPTKTAYKYGDTFNKAGMVVNASYASGASKAVTGYTTSPTTALTLSDTSISISYTENGVTKNASQTITVSDYLSKIEITTAPTKTAYKHGDNFVSTGMAVKATMASGATSTISDYTVTDGTSLTAGKTSVTLSYTAGGVTKTCTQAITVADVLTEISVTTAPTKTSYIIKDNFDKTGMVVKASYASGTSKEITGYTVTDGTNLTADKTSVTLSYTEGGVTKTCTQAITVINAWEVPTGCTYTTVGGTTYNAGDLIPETYTVQSGDIFVDSDYEYRYNQYFEPNTTSWTSCYENGWCVKVRDNSKSSYGTIAASINNKDTKRLSATFYGCTSMTAAPTIPSSTVLMENAFYGCTSLATAPAIPGNVINMRTTFRGCTSLTAAPTLPSKLKVLQGTFYGCTLITTAPEIPDSVENMSWTFNGCTSLTSAPTIPSGVTTLKNAFYGCTSLKGNITINANPTEYESCFKNSAKDASHIITLTGSASAATIANLKATGYSDGKYIAPFNVVWKSQDGTTALETDTGVAYNTAPSYGAAAPTKIADASYTYAFAGWSTSTNSESGTAAASLPKVTCDTVYYAAFSKTPNAVSVTWVDGNGNTLKTDSVSYGSTPSYSGSTPTKTSTAQYDYTFTGWSPAVGAVTTATTYTAQFSSTTRKYNITWVDGDGNTIKTDSVAYGTTPSYSGSTPTKTETNSYAYTFTGWSPTVAAVTGAATYTAQFSSTAKYAIKWVDGDGNTLKTDYVKSGTKPSYTGDTPTKSPDTTYEYTFTGWSPTVANATANATYTATFSSSERKCTITVLVNDASYGTVSVSSYRIKYGYYISTSSEKLRYKSSSKSSSTTFATATAASQSAEFTYSFDKWTKDGSTLGSSAVQVTSDITVVANFKRSTRTYTVTVKCSSTEGSLSGGTGLSSSSKTVKDVPYGTVITSSENKVTINGTIVTATGISGSGTTYTFSSWTNGSATVTGDITVTANFSSTTATYTVSVASNNTNYGTVNVSSISSVPHNSSISISGNTMTINGTTVTATPKSGYYFKAWSVSNGDKITGNKTVTATFEAEVLTGISVTTPPSQTTYNVGDSFNTSGMVVTATYKSGATKAITPTVQNGESLSQDAFDVLYYPGVGFGESNYNHTNVAYHPYNSSYVNTSYSNSGSAYQGTLTRQETSSGYKMSLTPKTTGTTGNYYIQRTYSGSKLNEMKNYGGIVYMNADVTTSGANYTAPCIIIAKSDWSSTVCVSNFLTSTGSGTAYINLSDYSFDNSTNYVIGWGMMATTGTVTFTMGQSGIIMFGMNTQTIQMCYTENGVTKWCQTNVTVNTDETVILDGATTTAAGGKWVSGGVTMVNVGEPTFSNGVKLYPTTYNANTSHGCLAWSGKKVSLTAGQKISVILNEGYTFTCPYDTNLAYGAFTGEHFYVVLSPNATNLSGNFRADTYLTDNGATLYQYAVAQHPYFVGTATTATIAAGTYTVTVTQSGSYYVGLLAEGYDTSKTSFTGNISKVVVW